jgi:hypothetical protein
MVPTIGADKASYTGRSRLGEPSLHISEPWSSADAKEYKFKRCEIVTSRVLLVVGNNHEQMGNANAQQYKGDSPVPAHGGAKGYEKANNERHPGECQVNVTRAIDCVPSRIEIEKR